LPSSFAGDGRRDEGAAGNSTATPAAEGKQQQQQQTSDSMKKIQVLNFQQQKQQGRFSSSL
jgi:hypothetical protein